MKGELIYTSSFYLNTEGVSQDPSGARKPSFWHKKCVFLSKNTYFSNDTPMLLENRYVIMENYVFVEKQFLEVKKTKFSHKYTF